MKIVKNAYLIVMKPEVLLERYERSWILQNNAEVVKQMRRAFTCFPPGNYRGISRSPLEGDSWADPVVVEAFESTGIDMHSDKEARTRLFEVLDRSEDDYDIHLIDRLVDAREIFRLLDHPEDREIIEIRRDNFEIGPATLGFDIGYWGCDHFSLIADSIVIPQWHPPVPEDYVEVARQFSALNQHLLFSRPDEAERFRTYYKSCPWAETEFDEGEFCIIQVDQVAERESD